MPDRPLRRIIGLDQRKSRARHVNTRIARQFTNQRPRKHRLPGPKIAAQQQHITGLQCPREFGCMAFRVIFAVRSEIHMVNKYAMSNEHKTDVVIIGAGPVGLFAVFQCGMVGLSCHVVDALEDLGGQCTALYPEKPIYDIPGYPEIAASDLIAQLEHQAAPFSPVYHLGQQAVSLERKENSWRLGTSKGTVIEAPAIIIAGGAGAFGPNRPPLERLESYEGTSVFYMVRRRDDFAGKRIVIAGGGDTALDWALSLEQVAEKIMVVHRRDKFRGAPDSVAKLHALAGEGRIDLVVPWQLKGLEGENGRLSAVQVISMDGEEKSLEADTLLPFFGLATELGPIAEWDLTLDHHQINVDPTTCATNQPGIYAIGDIATYPNKLKLILTGFAESAQAAHDAYRLIHPDRALHFEYSTTSGVPGSAGSKKPQTGVK